jgi:positive regulator of sigma E activity
LRLEKDKVILQKLESEECATCKQGFCKVGIKSFDADNPLSLDLKDGDYVKVEMDSKLTLAAVFLVFIMPLLLFMGFYAVVNIAFPAAAEGWKTGAGFLGLVCGFGITALVSKLPFFQKRPVILEVLDSL